MQDVRVDHEGNLRCWNCGGKNFLEKRTGRAHIVGYATVGIGALATKKKLKCYQCGAYNQVGNAQPFDPQSDEDAFILVPARGEMLPAEPILLRGRAVRTSKTVNQVVITIKCLDNGKWAHPNGKFTDGPAPHLTTLSTPGKTETDWQVEWCPPCTGHFEIHASTGIVGPMTASREFEIAAEVPSLVEDIDSTGGPSEAPSTPTTFSVASELRNLADLRSEGILTDEEFESEKRRLLSRV